MSSNLKPFVIPVFIPQQGCPSQCLFCDQAAITGVAAPPDTATIKNLVNRFAGFNHKGRRPVQLSFYGGNFLGLPEKEIIRLLNLAEQFVYDGLIDSIRFSTRPDTITRDTLGLLAAYTVTTIELGIQSLDDIILSRCRRGHTAAQSEQALALIREYGFEVGVQIMIGLPGDDGPPSVATAERLAALAPAFARIYPTLVIAGSPLARLFQKGEYQPLPLDEAVRLTAVLYDIFSRKDIAVIRMGLQPTEDLSSGTTVLAGPYHPAFGQLVLSEIFYHRTVALLSGRSESNPDAPETLTIRVPPGDGSVIRGQRNTNLTRLKRTFGFQTVRIIEDDCLAQGQIVCD